MRVLAGGMLLGVAGRLLSLAVTGTPAPLAVALIAVEATTTALVLAVSLRTARSSSAIAA